MSPGLELSEVEVVICTYRSRGEVEAAVSSCLESGLTEAQLTVVDNASEDGTAELVADRFPQLRLLRLDHNLGFGAANNLAAEDLPGRALLLLNPDAVLVGDALKVMLQALAVNPRRGAISPRISRPDGRLDAACRRSFPTPVTALWRLGGLSRLRPGSSRFGVYNLSHLAVDQGSEIDSGSGACLLIRREIWDRLGGFDRRFYMYGEDLDLCWRLQELGFTVWYEPSARVVHRKGSSSRQVAIPMLVAFHGSMWRFYRLHYLRGWNALWAPLVALGILLRLSWLLFINSWRRHPTVSP
ncbi:MAG TPA: glycosyltransferase family 2 protein [Candidatus Dormibacteraeota bacterium]|nr:glycosyltransferase family 2 protein [Candidatus Dormibacteraeota bacterium]